MFDNMNFSGLVLPAEGSKNFNLNSARLGNLS